MLQAAFQHGSALTTAGLSTLLTNALPIAAGMVLFHEPLPVRVGRRCPDHRVRRGRRRRGAAERTRTGARASRRGDSEAQRPCSLVASCQRCRGFRLAFACARRHDPPMPYSWVRIPTSPPRERRDDVATSAASTVAGSANGRSSTTSEGSALRARRMAGPRGGGAGVARGAWRVRPRWSRRCRRAGRAGRGGGYLELGARGQPCFGRIDVLPGADLLVEGTRPLELAIGVLAAPFGGQRDRGA